MNIGFINKSPARTQPNANTSANQEYVFDLRRILYYAYHLVKSYSVKCGLLICFANTKSINMVVLCCNFNGL
jgi:hypothetical protein